MSPPPSSSRRLSSILVAALLLSPAAVHGQATDDGWDVADPPGPSETVRFTVDEGTWMSVDVSPDGSTLVFDLLGDIYTLPVEGGTATRILGGVPWEIQPRFSPDGDWIAYTSDRHGGHNLWIARADGSDARPVSEESYRLMNNPAWSPDGDYLVGRKHFTSRRSLGAGEMWMVHRAGGDGVRLTERRNDQQDANEPVFSPDGHHLYYSEDLTPGPSFQYNKDPYPGIYGIRRLDLETGELETLISGPGGAARPTPSPDGETLAYVKRDRLETVLVLHDLASGAERVLYRGLDHDQQEAWAIHGVYPAFSWTPDAAAIVIWAGGELRRIDVASGEATAIPFRVDVELQVQEALRFDQEVAPEEFKARMLRWATVSPAGDRVVYSAVGGIWVRDLPEGEPRRISGDEELAYYPAWSPDGDEVVYVSWDDQALATIRIRPAGGGAPRDVEVGPGHYAEPAFTPDGDRIVYRRAAGGGLVSPLWSRDPGIYVAPVDGSAAPRRISRGGRAPHFGPDADRVYLTDSHEDRAALVSVELDGDDGDGRRVHLTSDNATELTVSPDGRWVAYTERYQAYVVALPTAGGPVHVGPGQAPVPVARVSDDSGAWMHFSGDSSRLHWSLGPELYSLELDAAFDFLGGGEATGPEAATVLDVAPTLATDVPSGSVAFVGGRIVTMDGDEVIEDGTLVVRGNRIAAVGPRDAVEVPEGAHVVDASGDTLIPGLVDVHAHGGVGANGFVPEQNWGHYASLAFGVTTQHDPSNDTSLIFTASEMARAGRIVSPRIFSTGTVLYGASGDIRVEIQDLDDARFHLRRMKKVGAFTVKSYNQPRRDQRQQILAAARELEMMVVPEGGSNYQMDMTMIVDGHTGIEHNIPVAPLYDDALSLFAGSGTYYTPTLVVSFGGLSGEYYWYQHTNVWEHERLVEFVPRERVDARSRRRIKAPEGDFHHVDVAASAAELVERGGSVQIGAHGQLQGLAAHWETWMLEQGGMTPHQALRAATLAGAEYLGLDGDLGSLQEGKLADLVVLDGDPLEDLRQTQSARLVMVNGRLFDAVTLDQVGNHPEEREPLYWEE